MATRLLRFGLFELDVGKRQLHKGGRRVRLQQQPLRVLEVLLEKPGEVVAREELRQRLWPSDIYLDFEVGLNGAIKRLRLSLGDSADNPRFIETVPKCGYRFIAPVQLVTAPMAPPGKSFEADLLEAAGARQANSLTADVAAETPTARRSPNAKPRGTRKAVAAVVGAVVMLAAYMLRPTRPPLQVTRIVQLSKTGDAWPLENLMSDGARLYYTERTGTAFQLRQILLNGNEDTVVAGLPANSLIKGLSADQTTFLAMPLPVAGDPPRQFWSVPLFGGPRRRLGSFLAHDAGWSPDGSSLVYALNNQLFSAGPDGTGDHLLASLPGQTAHPRWSPEGRRIRFTVENSKGQLTIWEVGVDGRHLHEIQVNLPGNPMEGFGEWTPDGRYFVFESHRNGNLWAVEDGPDWLHRRRLEPIQLTAGPMSYYRPLPSRDGKQIFAVATKPVGELLRYDAARKEFVQFMGGASVDHLDFTRDRRWVAYVAYPEGTLWRARNDGSESLQLTFPPLQVIDPHWSPDGKRIAFAARQPGELMKIYTISPEGGSPELLSPQPHSQFHPTWARGADSIVYDSGRDAEDPSEVALYRAHIPTGRTEKIPGTDGLYFGSLSPDGKNLAAVEFATRRVFLIDLKTGRRTQLTQRQHPQADYPTWSADSQYLYFNDLMSTEPAIFGVHVSDGKEEKITEVNFRVTGVYGMWSGPAPDGSPLVLRYRAQTDVYALALAPR